MTKEAAPKIVPTNTRYNLYYFFDTSSSMLQQFSLSLFTGQIGNTGQAQAALLKFKCVERFVQPASAIIHNIVIQ